MTIDRFEKGWLTAVFVTLGAFTAGRKAPTACFGLLMPSPVERLDPQNLANTDFANPGLRKTGTNRFELYMTAKMWSFDAGREFGAVGVPPKIVIPRGSIVQINVTSIDVMHGFYVEDHAVNLELVPGQVARISQRFNKPGTYKIICNHYCGTGHQIMYGEIVVQ